MLREAPLPVLHADAHLAAVAKPPGLLAHRSAIAPGERDVLLVRLREQFGRRVYLAHRLDRATSGVVLFAFSEEVAALLGKAFAERRVGKRYLALVRGWFDPAAGAIERPLAVPGRGLKPALTRYRTLATLELPVATPPHGSTRWSLVEAIPETGRFHQIRRHFKHAAHPVLGDVRHGDARHNRLLWSMGLRRLMLHAHALELEHPLSGERLRLVAPPDEEWRALAARLALPLP